MLKVLSTEIRSGCIEQLLDADDLELVSKSLRKLKERLGAWKVALDPKELSLSFKKTKMITCGKNASKCTEWCKFPCTVCKKGIIKSSNSIHCTFCRCLVWMTGSGIKKKIEGDSKFKCQACANQQGDVAKDYSSTESKGQSVEFVDFF